MRFADHVWMPALLCTASLLTACTPTASDGGDSGDGDAEGATEGDVEGTAEGNVDGATEGAVDGAAEGDIDGTVEGDVDGEEIIEVGQCHVQLDCEGDQSLGDCTHAEMSALFPVCGIGPIDEPDQCGTNELRCDVGQVCDRVFGGCGGTYLACVEPCASDLDCALDEQCSDGQCVALDCRYDGYACPSTMACSDTLEVPDPLGDDRLHGCVFLTCTSDDDCAGGDHCVTGLCSSLIGTCELPRP